MAMNTPVRPIPLLRKKCVGVTYIFQKQKGQFLHYYTRLGITWESVLIIIRIVLLTVYEEMSVTVCLY